MQDENPYLSPRHETSGEITVRFSDALPAICIVCGAPATGTTTKVVATPDDPTNRTMTRLQWWAFLSGWAFLWQPRRIVAEHSLLRLPHCEHHADLAREAIDVRAINHLKVQIVSAAPEFCEALAALQAPPSPETLATMDAGTNRDGDFLKAIEKSNISSPSEFLKGLEGQSE
jgi:hypothetical protein